VCSLQAEVNSTKIVDVKKEYITIGDVCTARVSADCDGDGNYETSVLVDCEHADVMVEMLETHCGN
jgi:hypothetical protein